MIAASGINQDLAKKRVVDRVRSPVRLFRSDVDPRDRYVALPKQPYGPLVVLFYVLGITCFLILSSDAAIGFVKTFQSKFQSMIVKKVAKVLGSFRNHPAWSGGRRASVGHDDSVEDQTRRFGLEKRGSSVHRLASATLRRPRPPFCTGCERSLA